MTVIQRQLGPSGSLSAKVIPAPKAPLTWRLRNALRPSNLWGRLANGMARSLTRLTGIPTITAELRARVIHADGSVEDYGIVSRRVVTTAGVGFLVDDWDGSVTDISTMNYHACGTGGTAEAVGDTALVTEETTSTSRATGTITQPSANVLQTLATQAFTGSVAVVEHGLFSVITASSGVLWDRSVFTVINVTSGDSIQWTYQCTINAGG